ARRAPRVPACSGRRPVDRRNSRRDRREHARRLARRRAQGRVDRRRRARRSRRDRRRVLPLPRGVLLMLAPSKAVPSRGLPLLAGTAVVVLALPVFVIAGWELGAWALAAVCWAVFQGIGFLLARVPLGADKLGNSGLVAMGRMLRTIGLM